MPKGAPVIEGRRIYQKVVYGGIAAAIGLVIISQSPQNAKFGWLLLIGGGLWAVVAYRSVPNAQLLMKYHNDPRKTVRELLEQWQPQSARLEAEYEKSLYGLLKSKLNGIGVKIIRQHGAGRVKCDIAIGSDVFIELKKGLRGTNRLQRLIGQIELYRNEWPGKPVFVVLLGESQDDLLHDLNRSVSKYESVVVITKNVAAPADTEEPQEQQAASAGTP